MKRSAAACEGSSKRPATGGSAADLVRQVLENVLKSWSQSSSAEARKCAKLLEKALASQQLSPWQDPDGIRSPPPPGLDEQLERSAEKADAIGENELAAILKGLRAANGTLSWKYPRHLLSAEIRAPHSTHSLSLASLLGGESHFLSAMMVGSSRYGASFASEELLLGLTYLAPGTRYPQHAHDAAEVYQMLVGTGQWGPTFDHLEDFKPGSFLFLPSAAPHAICAPSHDPLLAMYAWTGNIRGRFWFCDCLAGNKYIININKITQPEDYYDKMAGEYEAVVRGWGYCMPEAAADALQTKGVGNSADHVLDLGCGDGLVGSALYTRGYRHITGCDISGKMLEKAKDRACYSELRKADLQKTLPFDAGSFDAVVCVGTTTYLQPSVLHDWLRVVRCSGLLVFTHKSLLWPAWETEHAKLVEGGMWQLRWCSEPLHYLPSLPDEAKASTDERVKVYVYMKT